MRVAYICADPGVPVFGSKGCSIHCQEIIRAMVRRGFEVEVFATRLGGNPPDDLGMLRAHRVQVEPSVSAADREVALVDANRHFYRMLVQRGPFDVVYERHALWSSAAMEFAEHHGAAGVLEVNAPLIEEQKTYRTLIDEGRARDIRARAFRFASSLVAVSEQVATKICEEPSTQSKVAIVPNGVDIRRFDQVAETRQYDANGPLTIGFVGTLKPWHGVSNLLESFSKARDQNENLRLLVVGDGPEKEFLQNRLKTFSSETVQAVTFMGAVKAAEIPAVLSAMDLGVAPYPALEEFYFSPLKIVEYMAAGLPVVASRIGQIGELLEDGSTGHLVAPGCRHELTDALLQLASSASQRQHLGRSARRYVAANYTWDMVLEKILATLSHDRLNCEVG